MYVVPDPKASPLYSARLFIFCLLSLCLILLPSYHYYLIFTSFFSVYQSRICSLPFSLSLTIHYVAVSICLSFLRLSLCLSFWRLYGTGFSLSVCMSLCANLSVKFTSLSLSVCLSVHLCFPFLSVSVFFSHPQPPLSSTFVLLCAHAFFTSIIVKPLL